jgi:hypothetical protein
MNGATRWVLSAALLLAGATGCGPGPQGAPLSIRDLGLKMHLPVDWFVDAQSRLESEHGLRFYDIRKPDDNFGIIQVFAWQDDNLEEVVRQQAAAAGANILSIKTRKLGSYPAVEMTSQGEFTVLEINVIRHKRRIRIAWHTRPAEFRRQRAELRASLGSVRFD